MTFKYICFISYPHSTSSMMKEFVDELKRALVDELDPIFDEEVYIDKERLAGGDHFNEALARAICKSFCMVVIYVPKYEKHPFCLQEYRAMEILEEKRMKLAGNPGVAQRGMIIPIVLRGVEDLPDDIKKRIHYLDFSRYTTASAKIRRNKEYVGRIGELARKISELYRLFEHLDPCKDCDDFSLPDVNVLKPFRSADKSLANPFPGSQRAL
jgi:TIR domain